MKGSNTYYYIYCCYYAYLMCSESNEKFILMIHLHRAVAMFMVMCLLAFTYSAQAKSEADSLLCNELIDSVQAYSYRYDANDVLRSYAVAWIECADSAGSTEIHMEALSVLGVTYLRENDYPKALEVFHKNQKMELWNLNG